MSGKGSSPRPFSVPPEKFSENWDRIFGKDEAKERNNYQDILSTEDCILDVLKDETQSRGC